MPSQKPLKAAGRTLTEFGVLKPGETILLDACRTGNVAILGKLRPEEPTDDNVVRASFVRFMALGGDEFAPIHEHGVQLQGAWIQDLLDLDAEDIPVDLWLANCKLVISPLLRGANISGSEMPGLRSDRLICSGSNY